MVNKQHTKPPFEPIDRLTTNELSTLLQLFNNVMKHEKTSYNNEYIIFIKYLYLLSVKYKLSYNEESKLLVSLFYKNNPGIMTKCLYNTREYSLFKPHFDFLAEMNDKKIKKNNPKMTIPCDTCFYKDSLLCDDCVGFEYYEE